MRRCLIILVLLTGAVVLGFRGSAEGPAQVGGPSGTKADPNDRSQIESSARSFADAFNKGDAKAVAAMWTENGEFREPSGQTIVGRAAIEKLYAELFKANAGAKIEVLVKSVRFPAKDLAVEEGLLRSWRGSKDLPSSTAYVAVQVRENGQWKIALSSEAGAGQDRLEDLDWLLGDWTTKVKDDTMKLSLKHDPKKPVIQATFTRTAAGKEPLTGNIRIAPDPETGQIRSWGFEDDGAHSQALWFCDGKSWILDCRGVLADGTPTAERIVLQRVTPDIITWRAIDRVLGETPLPDTTPVRLTRAGDSR